MTPPALATPQHIVRPHVDADHDRHEAPTLDPDTVWQAIIEWRRTLAD